MSFINLQPPDSTSFTGWVNSSLARLGIRKIDLCRILCVPPSTVSRWFSGSVPHRSTVHRLEGVFGRAPWNNSLPSPLKLKAKPAQAKFGHLALKPGPHGWQNRAAKDLGYSPGYISRVISGKVISPAAEAALAEWKSLNLVESVAKPAPELPATKLPRGVITAMAGSLGVSQSHLSRVLAGERQSNRISQALKAATKPAQVAPSDPLAAFGDYIPWN